MSRQFSPGLHREAGVQVERIRSLPVPGKFLVEVGQHVEGSEILAQAELPGDLLMLRLPERMGLRAEEVVQGIVVAEGTAVVTGDLLCQHAGLFGLMRTTFCAPASGVVELISKQTGHIGLRLPSKKLELSAYVSGTVVALERDREITVRSTGTFVQGIFGVGGERFGVVTPLELQADQALDTASIPADCSGKILVGGTRPTITALRLAVERGAVGIVTGSIDDGTLKEYLGYDLGLALTGDEDVPMTIVLTEGFGNLSFSKRVADLLSPLAGMPASINGATQVRAGAVRPEVFVRTDTQLVVEASDKVLEIGSTVRVTRNPFFGELARVHELPSDPELLESGAKTRVVRLKRVDGSLVTVPRANVEL
jgi:hypothetical protein